MQLDICLHRTPLNNKVNNKYLPDKSEYVLFCEPTALQKALYRRVLSSSAVRSCLLSTGGGAPYLV